MKINVAIIPKDTRNDAAITIRIRIAIIQKSIATTTTKKVRIHTVNADAKETIRSTPADAVITTIAMIAAVLTSTTARERQT